MMALVILSAKWNISLRGPWEAETERHFGWELKLIPRESTWGDYPTFRAPDLGALLEQAQDYINHKQQ